VPPEHVLAALAAGGLPQGTAELDSDAAGDQLTRIGLLRGDDGALPERMAPFLALIEALPHQLTERLLTELLAGAVEPR
jgi:hypothetical protein